MSTESTSSTGKSPKGVGNQVLTGVLVTAVLAAVFWAGHEWKTEKSTETQLSIPLPTDTTKSPGGLSASRALSTLGDHSIADIAQAAAPSVVNINTKTKINISNSPLRFGPHGFQFFFGNPNLAPRDFESSGTGSGVIIRADGYILTNNHVVGKASDITVTLNDKRIFKGRVMGRDSFSDLALVKIDANNLPAIKFGSSKDLRPGDWAIAIGSPLGLDHTVTLGIISALGRSLDELHNNVELIQTDAAINPGNSGGPLLNIKGEVIGINTAIRSGAQNIGFAIPVDVANEVLQGLLSGGRVERPYVGIYMQELEPKLAKSLGLPANTTGVVVANVGQGSPADNAGIQQGDVLQRVDGQPVKTGKEVQTLIRRHKPGQSVDMMIARGRNLQAVTVKIGEYPSIEEQAEAQEDQE